MTPRIRSLAAALSLVAPLAAVAQNPVYTNPDKQIPAKVSIMAISTAVHQQFAGNQDTYLADVALKDGHQTARLIDLYSGAGSPIRRSLLTERRQFVMYLIRKHSCDIPNTNFFLDQTGYNIFDTSAPQALAATPDVPCYMVVHDRTRLVKN